jgi:hypothetical protein
LKISYTTSSFVRGTRQLEALGYTVTVERTLPAAA